MVALVEAHTAEEVERAAAAGAAVIGINNRDLTTFEVDLDTSIELHQLIPSEVLSIAESGVKGRSEARRMASAGYDGILVGEAAAGAEDPAAFIVDLLEGT
jgi:indole-3-glycerol phosphate synthase